MTLADGPRPLDPRKHAVDLVMQCSGRPDIPHLWIKTAIRNAGGEYVRAVPEENLLFLIQSLQTMLNGVPASCRK